MVDQSPQSPTNLMARSFRRYERIYRYLLRSVNRSVRKLPGRVKKPDHLLAAEIGRSYLKLGLIPSRPSDPRAGRMEVVSLPPDPDERREIVRAVLNSPPYAELSETTLILPQMSVITRFLQFPTTKEEELVEMTHLEAKRISPFPWDDQTVDFQIVKSDPEGWTQILIYIARDSSTRERIDLLRQAGKTTRRIEVAAALSSRFFLSDAVAEHLGDKPTLIVDLDYECCNLYMARDETVRFLRPAPFGAQTLDHGLPGNVRRQNLDDLVREVAGTIELPADGHPAGSIDQVILTGATQGAAELAARLVQALAVPVQQYDPQVPSFEYLKDATPDQRWEGKCSPSPIMGLFLPAPGKEINLLPADIRARQKRALCTREILKAAGLVILILVLTAASFEVKMSKKTGYLEELSAQLKDITESAREISEKKRTTDIILAEIYVSPTALDILYELHRLAPPGIQLEDFEFRAREKIIIKGQARQLADVFQIVEELKNSQLLDEVSLDFVHTSREPIEHQSLFQVTARLKG